MRGELLVSSLLGARGRVSESQEPEPREQQGAPAQGRVAPGAARGSSSREATQEDAHFSLSALQVWPISGTSGSSGLGSQSKEQMDKRTSHTVSAGTTATAGR